MTKRYTLGNELMWQRGLYWLIDNGRETEAVVSADVIDNISDACEIEDGYFYGGIFNGGRFTGESVTCYGGVFHSGEFYNGTYFCGEYDGGEIFYGGVYYGCKRISNSVHVYQTVRSTVTEYINADEHYTLGTAL